MIVLIGTTNPAKVKRFEKLLADYDVTFCTLKDLQIQDEPLEVGKTPEENAIIKAKFYGKYFDVVICNDSGLYFEELALSDERQPGLNIRTPMGQDRLDDEEMIGYYSNLVSSLGGKVSAYYLDGLAVYNKGKVTSFMDNGEAVKADSFYMVETPSVNRHEGWPLDSLSINKTTNTYFVNKSSKKKEVKENIMVGEYKKRLTDFLVKSIFEE